MPDKASILLAHGSSDPNWLAPFDQLVLQIRDQLHQERVELAYMELADPSLEHSIRQLADQGYRHIDVLPLFFAAGRHLRKDVPAMLDELQQQLASSGKQLTLELHQPIGLEPEMASAISQVVVRKLS